MPIRRAKSTRRLPRRGAAKPRVPRPVRRPRLMKRKVDYARVVEAFENPIEVDANGNYALNYTTQLSEFNRAQEVAHAYKYYRCAKIELVFVPYATMSLTGGQPAARMPQMYFTLDRVNNMWQAPTEEEMLERGVSPKIFKGIRKYVWKPNLLQHVQLETWQPTGGQGELLGIQALNAVNSVPLFNKWLPTQQSSAFKSAGGNPQQIDLQVTNAAGNPYALKYYGACCVINIEGFQGQAVQIGDLMTKVTWEFKGPRALKATGATDAEPYFSPQTSIINPAVVPNTQPSVYP